MTQKEYIKRVCVELESEHAEQFEIVKKRIGVKKDPEALRVLITSYYERLSNSNPSPSPIIIGS